MQKQKKKMKKNYMMKKINKDQKKANSYLLLDKMNITLCVYIYIYIVTVLVVTNSLYGFVVNQVWYNSESAQYLW